MKSALKSNRYMSRVEVAAHYCVSEASVRKPTTGSPLARLRQIKLGGRYLILRSDVAALDRQLERAAMTPYDAPPLPEIDHTADEDRAS
ncbi:MAG: hypothetical protein DMF64_00800 [Acidobacteria bacterium]|nr:MAG: hypothetical protein DMF64_00800 [Acidobacteriota bacterium]